MLYPLTAWVTPERVEPERAVLPPALSFCRFWGKLLLQASTFSSAVEGTEVLAHRVAVRTQSANAWKALGRLRQAADTLYHRPTCHRSTTPLSSGLLAPALPGPAPTPTHPLEALSSLPWASPLPPSDTHTDTEAPQAPRSCPFQT